MPPASFDQPDPMTVSSWWAGVTARFGDHLMLRHEGRDYSFAEIDRRSAAIARGLLAEGAGKGSRIGLLMPNGPAWITSWLAIQRIGGIAITLSTFFAPPELAYAISHGDVSILLAARSYLKHRYAERLEEAFPDLAGRQGTAILAFPACPYLRSVWFDEPVDAPWSRGTLANLEAIGAASATFPPDMLDAIQASTSPADLSTMIYTSGSTAAPKAVVHTQGTVVRKSIFMALENRIMPSFLVEGDRLLLNMPLFWIGGLLSALSTFHLGGTLLANDDHSAEASLRSMHEDGATSIGGSEAVVRSVMALPDFTPEDFARLKPHNVAQFPAFYERDGIHRQRIIFSLGMTETFGPHSGVIDRPFLDEPRLGANGRVLPGMAFRIVDPETGLEVAPGVPGELCVRGIWLMDGFYKRERHQVFDEDGFYHTGDGCTLDADGELYFNARLGGMIKTAGANVSPEEVENALILHPDILEVAVIGLDDRKNGQIVAAVVAPRAGSGLVEQDVKAWAKERLSSFKTPRRILFRDAADLPRTPSNKIRKPALEALFCAHHPQGDAPSHP